MPPAKKFKIIGSILRPFVPLAALLLAAVSGPVFAEKPLASIVSSEAKNPRESGIAEMFAASLEAALRSSGAFDQIDRALLAEQLERFGCDTEACRIGFARSAGISLLLGLGLEEQGGRLNFEVKAYGIDAPYFGRLVYKYEAKVPDRDANLTARESGLICEEHAIRAVAGALSSFKIQAPLKLDGEGGFSLPADFRVTAGEYELYRPMMMPPEHAIRSDGPVGKVRLDEKGRLVGSDRVVPEEGDYILIAAGEGAAELESLHRERKKETVFQNPGCTDALLAALFSIPASASMPIMAPLGHYRYGDFEGLCLWAANAAPWLYLEADGFLHRPAALRREKRDVSRETSARYNFAIYMLGLGGLPLFVDAFAHRYLGEAALYRDAQPVVGGEPTAVFLSLVSGGGGHFYKGRRFWGYLYFHLNNALVYSALREYSYSWRYDPAADSYDRSRGDRGRLRLYMGALGALKLIEAVHVLLLEHSISAGRVSEERFSIAPDVMLDDEGFLPGIRMSYRF